MKTYMQGYGIKFPTVETFDGEKIFNFCYNAPCIQKYVEDNYSENLDDLYDVTKGYTSLIEDYENGYSGLGVFLADAMADIYNYHFEYQVDENTGDTFLLCFSLLLSKEKLNGIFQEIMDMLMIKEEIKEYTITPYL